MIEKDTFEYRYQILIQEWEMVEANIGRLDRIAFTMRGWALALTSAGLAYAYSNGKPDLCIMLAFPILAIWLCDALFKMFQQKFMNRLSDIESYLASSRFDADVQTRQFKEFKSPQLAVAFSRNQQLSKRFAQLANAAFLHNVWIFYGLLLVFSFATYSVIEIGI